MRVLIGSQVILALVAALVALYRESVDAMLAVLYGAAIGIMVVLLARRSANKAAEKAIDSPSQGIVVMFAGLVLRYAAVILGLLVGLRVLQLMTVPMLMGFSLMIMVQVFVAHRVTL